MEAKGGIVPTLFIEAESVPEAHYKAIEAVWNHGAEKRTQYDQKDSRGNYLHPPSKDAQVLIKIQNPFSQPRFPAVSWCERGKYILEILGVKDHLVLPREEIFKGIDESHLGTQWPYSYHQRLDASPTATGKINQIENVVKRLEEDLNTRRAVMTTRVPEIDTLLKEDIPCLGEVHLRCFEDENGEYAMNMTTVWRSRDLFKAWADNVVAITYLGRELAHEIGKRTGKNIRFGGYTDFSNSLHIYGRDFMAIEGSKEKGKKPFFEVFPTVESYIKRSMDSETARELEVLPQMKALLGEEIWKFTEKERAIVEAEIKALEEGKLP